MKPIQGPEDLVLPDVTTFAPPVLKRARVHAGQTRKDPVSFSIQAQFLGQQVLDKVSGRGGSLGFGGRRWPCGTRQLAAQGYFSAETRKFLSPFDKLQRRRTLLYRANMQSRLHMELAILYGRHHT